MNYGSAANAAFAAAKPLPSITHLEPLGVWLPIKLFLLLPNNLSSRRQLPVMAWKCCPCQGRYYFFIVPESF